MESELYPQVQLAASARGARLFRNNVGSAWRGDVQRVAGGLLIRRPQIVHFGLAKGSADLIGWSAVRIQQHHVGGLVAVFTSCELKAAKGQATDDQARWTKAVAAQGGIACIAKQPADFEEALSAWSPI